MIFKKAKALKTALVCSMGLVSASSSQEQFSQGISTLPGGYRPAPMSTGNHAAAQATLERAELRKTENDDRDPEQEPKAWYHLLQQWLSGDDEDLKKIAEKHIKVSRIPGKRGRITRRNMQIG